MNALLVDIGGTYIRIGTINESYNRPIIVMHTPVEINEFLNCLLSSIDLIMSDYQMNCSNCVISVSCPGIIRNNMVEKSIYTCLTGIDLGGIIHERFDCTVYITNDANVQALGAYSGKTLLFMCIGTGIGGAYVKDDQILPGTYGYACELGHVFSKNTYKCKCGKIGCLDTIASGNYFVERFGNNWWKDVERDDIKSSLKIAGKSVGFVLSQAAMFCNPEEVLINGHICSSRIFREQVISEFNKNSWKEIPFGFDVDTWKNVYKGLKKIIKSKGV